MYSSNRRTRLGGSFRLIHKYPDCGRSNWWRIFCIAHSSQLHWSAECEFYDVRYTYKLTLTHGQVECKSWFAVYRLLSIPVPLE